MSTSAAAKVIAPLQTMKDVSRASVAHGEKTIKSGMELHEESVKLSQQLLEKAGAPAELRAKLESVKAEVLPAVRKELDEVVELFNRTGDQVVELFEKSLGIFQATSIPEAQFRIQDVVQSSLGIVHANVQTALHRNTRIMSSWIDLAGRFAMAGK